MNTIWKSEVTHRDKTFIVSTIRRRYVTAEGESTGVETMVFRTLEDGYSMGEAIHQAGGLNDHQAICKSLLLTGRLPVEEFMEDFYNCPGIIQDQIDLTEINWDEIKEAMEGGE